MVFLGNKIRRFRRGERELEEADDGFVTRG